MGRQYPCTKWVSRRNFSCKTHPVVSLLLSLLYSQSGSKSGTVSTALADKVVIVDKGRYAGIYVQCNLVDLCCKLKYDPV